MGVRTKGFVASEDLGHAASSNAYDPTRYAWLPAIIHALDLRPGQDVLLEYGAGKGRVLAACARLPFRKILGVELSAQLSEIARKNVAQVRRRRCADVEILTCDAAAYVPPALVTSVFLFNPFHPPVIDAVGERLRRSVLAVPRRLRIVYIYSLADGNYLAAWDWLSTRSEVSLGRREPFRLVVAVYDPQSLTSPPRQAP